MKIFGTICTPTNAGKRTLLSNGAKRNVPKTLARKVGVMCDLKTQEKEEEEEEEKRNKKAAFLASFNFDARLLPFFHSFYFPVFPPTFFFLTKKSARKKQYKRYMKKEKYNSPEKPGPPGYLIWVIGGGLLGIVLLFFW